MIIKPKNYHFTLHSTVALPRFCVMPRRVFLSRMAATHCCSLVMEKKKFRGLEGSQVLWPSGATRKERETEEGGERGGEATQTERKTERKGKKKEKNMV